ncbi:MAG: hypothetical protein ACOX4W_05615 [Bacilli bacterium]|jgi:hypothetical protein
MEKFEFNLASIKDILEIDNLYKRIVGTPGCPWDLEYPNKELAERDIKNNYLYVLKKIDK